MVRNLIEYHLNSVNAGQWKSEAEVLDPGKINWLLPKKQVQRFLLLDTTKPNLRNHINRNHHQFRFIFS